MERPVARLAGAQSRASLWGSGRATGERRSDPAAGKRTPHPSSTPHPPNAVQVAGSRRFSRGAAIRSAMRSLNAWVDVRLRRGRSVGRPSHRADRRASAHGSPARSPPRRGSGRASEARASGPGRPPPRHGSASLRRVGGARGGSSRPARPPARAARPRGRMRSFCSPVKSAFWVTSSPTIVTWRPLVNTRRAASGSAQMLNSAAGVVFPSPIDPAHDDDSLERRRSLGMAGDEDGDVRQRSDRDERHRPVGGRRDLGDDVHRVRLERRTARRRQVGAVETRLAVHLALRGTDPGRAAGRLRRPPGRPDLPTWSRTRIAFAVSSLQRRVPRHGRHRAGARPPGSPAPASIAMASSSPGSLSITIQGWDRCSHRPLRPHPRLDLLAPRHRRLAAMPLDGERRGCDPPLHGLLQRPALPPAPRP